MNTPPRTARNEAEAVYLAFLEEVYAATPELEGDTQFIPTSQAQVILARVELARKERFGFGLVYGPAGSGKTTTIKFYVAKHAGHYIRAYPNFDASNLLEQMATALKITRIRNYRTLIAMVEDSLKARGGLLFAIDEAQLCTRNALEVMKYLGDETGSTFILLTTDEYVSGIRRYRDIESRIGVTASISALSLTEFYELYVESGFNSEVLLQIYTFSGGVMRDVLRLVRQIDHIIDLNPHKLNRGVMTPRLVKAGADKLNLTGGMK
jgi:DNA transposition AAA+ family ATPase